MRAFTLPQLSASWLAIALATLLAPTMGGATALWARAILLIVTAAFFIVVPPRRSLGVYWNVAFVAFAVLASTAFLPASWFEVPAWRAFLASQPGVDLPATRSAQPWLSLEASCLLLAGLAWAYYLFTQLWTADDRRRALQTYAAGIALLGAAALLAWWLGQKPPFWPETSNSPINFGFFPNRNHTANVLALGGIVMVPLAFAAFKAHRRSAYFWLLAIVVTGVALVADYSRAGILLFFGGAAASVAGAIAVTSSRKGGALTAAGVAVLLAAFFLFGGETLKRFQPREDGTHALQTDFRVPLQKDVLALSGRAPWLGHALGNFEPVFSLARQHSAMDNRALHPESDWLWVVADMGWPAGLLLVGAFIPWLWRCLPFAPGSDRLLRLGAMVAGCAFALHGFADVSGHRAGAAWPALFLLSMALSPARPLRPSRWVPPLFRMLGLVLAVVGGWWLASVYRPEKTERWPTSQTLAHFQQRLDAQSAAEQWEAAAATATAALRIAPLDWRLYYQRALAGAVAYLSTSGAARDFAIARHLEPRWVKPSHSEGQIWLSVGQADRAVDAWKEALKRAGKDAPRLYSQMLGETRGIPAMQAALRDLAQEDRAYFLPFLQQADPFQCKIEIDWLLLQDPALRSFTAAERSGLFDIWYRHGNREQLIRGLFARPDWQADGWRWLVEDFVSKKDFQQAYLTARKFTPAPAIPPSRSAVAMDELERRFRYNSESVTDGLALFRAQVERGQADDAAKTLSTLQKIDAPPAYLAFLEAEVWEKKGDWEKAWAAWERFRRQR